jgi:hypothetical protein
LVGEGPAADIIGEVAGSCEGGDARSSGRDGNDKGGEADHFGGGRSGEVEDLKVGSDEAGCLVGDLSV